MESCVIVSAGYQAGSGEYTCNHGGSPQTNLSCSPHICNVQIDANMEGGVGVDSCDSNTTLNAVFDRTCEVRCKYGYEDSGQHQMSGTYECNSNSSSATTSLQCSKVFCSGLPAVSVYDSLFEITKYQHTPSLEHRYPTTRPWSTTYLCSRTQTRSIE